MNKILSIIQVLVPLVALLALGIGMLRGKRAGMPAIQFAQKIMAGLIVLTLIVGAVAASKFGWLAFALLTVSGLIVASAMLLGAYLGVKLRGETRYNLIVLVLVVVMFASESSVNYFCQRVKGISDQLGLDGGAKYEPEKNKNCPENLKSLYNALSMYVQDNDALPSGDNWNTNEELVSKVRRNEWLHCPSVSNRADEKYGYALNDAVLGKKLNGKSLKELPNAAKTPLLFDSINLAKNAHGDLSLLPKPGRHQGKNNILYCDGHVESR